MTIALVLLATLGLLAALVLGLHSHQLARMQSSADQSSPLPPLGAAEGSEHDWVPRPPSVDGELYPGVQSPRQARDGAPSPTETAAIRDEDPDRSGGGEAGPAPAGEDAGMDGSPLDSWLQQAGQLKKNHDLDGALALCAANFPLWSAYQQAVLIHRARIRELASQDLPIESELSSLYRLAAVAALLHDQVPGLPHLALPQLRKIDLQAASALPMPYAEIGYSRLRLIRKTDVRLMLKLWGDPAAHLKPREYHAQVWRRLANTEQAPLF